MDSPDVIHGRMKEGAHIAGYSLQRAMENLRWLLEDSRYEQLASGYRNVNDFLRDTQDAFKLLNINPEERKQIAELVKELQPKASQRAIGELMGVSDKTIGADLGAEYSAKTPVETPENAEYSAEEMYSKWADDNKELGLDRFGDPPPPALPPDDYDPIIRERKKQERQRDIDRQIKEIESGINLPDGLFEVIVIDPPWPYGTKYDPLTRRAANPYPEMSLDEIANIDLYAADDCVLWLWTTHKFMRYSFELLDKWGFRDVAIVTWVKSGMGLGSWLRSQSEFCIMAVKGSPIVKLTNQTTIIHGPLREHSRKPDEFYQMVDSLCVGRKLDYYSRQERDGWALLGNDTERFNNGMAR